jgi:hypothetical protein
MAATSAGTAPPLLRPQPDPACCPPSGASRCCCCCRKKDAAVSELALAQRVAKEQAIELKSARAELA